MLMVENPINGQSISTDEIRENKIVFSFPLNNEGSLRVTPRSSIIILDGNILFPDVRRDAVNVIIMKVFWKIGINDNDEG